MHKQLHRCDFIESAQNIVLVGGPETGKTHLATAIGICEPAARRRCAWSEDDRR